MNTKIIFSFIFLLSLNIIVAQNVALKSIHQQESEYYNQFNIQNDSDWNVIRGAFKPNGRVNSKACNLNKIVFGWYPYWSNGLEANYDWSLISDLSYFSYDVDPATGNATTTHSWATANAVTQAIANGVRVNLCVTLFSGHATFFASSTSQQTLITNLINLVQSRGANGVNIDFEAVPSSQKVPFNNFLVNLCNQMHSAIPGSQVSIALYSVDWSGVFDIPTINNYIDLFIIMGYDYYYGGSATAGPTSGLYSLTNTYDYNVSKSINSYLNAGVSSNKLVLGLPYYGFNWTTTSNTVPSSTTATGTSRTYKTIRDNVSGFYSSANEYFNADSYVPYFVYNNGGWNQAWVDDAFSLGKKFELVYKRDIAGIGIWALGYDDGYPDLWNKISEKLTTCRIDACTDTIYDMGGPSWNYYNKENYFYTISPAGASSVSLNFSTFNLETGYDSLWIFDGNTPASPLIGGYSGTSIPSTITSTGPSITIQFHSDNTTTAAGFTAIWQCLTDIISPTTTISTINNWKTSDFTANFTDIDNINGTGVEKSFYNVTDFDGTFWSANANNGFFKDDFDILNQNWINYSGIWNVVGASLSQTDEANGNTNIYAPLNQTLSNRYLYQFRAKAYGAGASRRFGFHFFCDSANYSNRNNSYFIWFRVDDQSLQFYKVTNDVFALESTISNVVTTPNQWYDFKITYDRITGKITVWRDNIYIGSWTDLTPYSTNGNYVSFRTGNCSLDVDEINVFRSRYPSVTITLGDSTKDIRFQNFNPATPSAKINSVVVDASNNLSTIVTENENIDWTPPSNILLVNDSLLNDIDTLYINTQLSANWQASNDINSDVAEYWYSIGTSQNDSNTVNWTNNLLNLSFTNTGLTLSNGTIYFSNVKVKNGAGLYSQTSSSDGVLILNSNTINENYLNNISIFPNPVNSKLIITVSKQNIKINDIKIYNLRGKEMKFSQSKSECYTFLVDVSNLSNGVYILELNVESSIKQHYKFTVLH